MAAFFQKVAIAFQEKPRWFLDWKTLIQKLSKTACFEGSKASPQQGVQQTIINQQEDMQ